MISPKQSITARAVLGLSQRDAADLAGMSFMSVQRFERGDTGGAWIPAELHRVYRKRGVVFTGGDGYEGIEWKVAK